MAMGSGGEEERKLPGFFRGVIILFNLAAIFVVINQTFLLLIGGVIITTSYFYLVIALYLPLCFLTIPPKKGIRSRWVFRLDVFLAALSLGILLNFAWHGYDILNKGWEFFPPLEQAIMAGIMWLLLLESLRRTGGRILAIVAIILSAYPLYAQYMPGLLQGTSLTLGITAPFHLMSMESAMGVIMRTFVGIIIGYMLFGFTMQATGGAKAFLDLALAFLGRTRGGAAKVSVVASALFGSISGSATANIITTGAVTIPAMKKTGYPPHYAAGIEGCASTGGAVMPPVMGSVAFIMAMLLSISYHYIVIAAIIPALLYYSGLLVQVDSFAARAGLRGLPKEELPSLKQVLLEAWPYLLGLGVLLYFLLGLRQAIQAPFYGTVALLLGAMIRKETRFTINSFVKYIEGAGRLLIWMAGMLVPLGLMLGGLIVTGVAFALAKEISLLAGGNITLLLLFGALSSAVLGMGLTATPCYIIVAITIAPALIIGGILPLAAHLFVFYCGLWSAFTPPVAYCAAVAAPLAGSSYMKTAFTMMRLGIILFFVPFFFVLDPALILQGTVLQILQAFSTAVFGVLVITSALEGYLLWVGRLELWGKRTLAYSMRLALIVGGVMLALPGWQMDILGLVIVAVALLPFLSLKLRAKAAGV